MKKIIGIMAVAVLASSVFAAEYGWQKGLSENTLRHLAFEKVSTFKTDAEREAYMESCGIGGDGPYHDAEHLDTEDYDDKEMKDIRSKFQKNDLSKMTEAQRQKFFEGLKK